MLNALALEEEKMEKTTELKRPPIRPWVWVRQADSSDTRTSRFALSLVIYYLSTFRVCKHHYHWTIVHFHPKIRDLVSSLYARFESIEKYD